MAIAIRRAERQDAERLIALVNALADYEKLDRPTADACERLVRDGWPERGEPKFAAWLAEDAALVGSAAIGYAITFFTYSSFQARPTLYIEDIFVLPEHRRGGAGTALFGALVEEARRSGCARIEWVVLDWNTSAQQFYRKLGANHLADWQYYRLDLSHS
jgi:GNAT superfamily N-acetyltransferase